MRNFGFSDSTGKKLLFLLCCLLNTAMVLILAVSVNSAFVELFHFFQLYDDIFPVWVSFLIFLIYFFFLIYNTTHLMTNLSPPPSRLYPDITCAESKDFCVAMAEQAKTIARWYIFAFVLNCLNVFWLLDAVSPFTNFQQRMAVLPAGQSAPPCTLS